MLTFEKIILITGHYGCGKTNLAVNLALSRAKAGEKVTIVDLDIVNPYFRTNDCRALLEENGISVLATNFASTNLDVPSLPANIPAKLRMGEETVILDVGGDDAGAIALGQYVSLIAARPYEMLYVYNPMRLLTASPEEAEASLRDIETASRLRMTALVNNANLGSLTTIKQVEEGIRYGEELSKRTGLPLKMTCVTPEIEPETEGWTSECFPMELYVKPVV